MRSSESIVEADLSASMSESESRQRFICVVCTLTVLSASLSAFSCSSIVSRSSAGSEWGVAKAVGVRR